MNFEDLTPEQREMAKSCKTPEEFLELAQKLGCTLSEEELEAVSGGAVWSCSDETSCSPHVCGKVCSSGSTAHGGHSLM